MEEISKICLIDDDMTSLTTIRNMLKSSYTVYPSPSAAKFFELIEEVTPDLILMDVDMPKMNGYEAVKRLKEDDRFKDIPVIFLAAEIDEQSELKGFELGAVDYFTKPFHPSIVKARVATHLTIVEQKRIIDKISLTDTLTKIPNKRSFESYLDSEWKRAIREDLPISILMIDADHFKNFNDNYGHQQGDAALQALAHVIDTSIRRGADFAARLGDDEFAVLLPNTYPDGVLRVAENIRENVESAIIPRIDDASLGLHITVSIGGASMMPDSDSSLDDFVKQANDALRKAKEADRNKVFISL